jgi:hypothetical protein
MKNWFKAIALVFGILGLAAVFCLLMCLYPKATFIFVMSALIILAIVSAKFMLDGR